MSTWLSDTQPLAPLITPEEYTLIHSLLTNLQRELNNSLTQNQEHLTTLSHSESLTSKGSYRDNYLALIGPEHKNWPKDIIGHRSMYHRYNIERTRHALLARKERAQIATICAQHDWAPNNKKAIWDALEQAGIATTTGNLNNILRAKKIPEIPTEYPALLDYTLGDKQVIRQKIIDNTIHSTIRVQGEWITIPYPIPAHLKPHNNEFSKPIIRLGDNDELLIQYAYKPIIEDPPRRHPNWALGADLGKIKPFAGGLNYGDGSYSTELTYSRELQHLKEEVELTQQYIDDLKKLQGKRASLLAGREDNPTLRAKWERAEEQLDMLRVKRSRLKDQASWVAARDVVNHAVERGASVIKVEELSWLESRGGLWDYARTQQRIEHVGSLVGISMVKVDSRDTSHTNPFTGKKVATNERRELVLEDGENLDRDYGAGLEVSCRPRKRGRKPSTPKRESLNRGSCRDKHVPTPKRPRSPSNRRKRKLMREEGYHNVTWAAFTVAVPLWSKRSADRHSLPRAARAGGSTIFTMDHSIDLLRRW